MAIRNEVRIFKTNTLEELRQKSNELSIKNVGDNSLLSAQLGDKKESFTASAGQKFFELTGRFEVLPEQTIDKTTGVAEAYRVGAVRVTKQGTELTQGLASANFKVPNYALKVTLTGSPTIPAEFVENAVLTQANGFSGTLLSADSTTLRFKSFSGTLSTSANLGIPHTDASKRVVASNISAKTDIDIGHGILIELISGASSGNAIVVDSTSLVDTLNELQGDVGSVESLTTTATTLQGAINEHDAELGTITAGAMGTTATTVSAAIAEHETQLGNVNINSIASGNNTITGALTQLHAEVGSLSLNTSATDLTAAVNEIEAVFDASARKINTTGNFDIDSSANIILDADGGNIVFKDNAVSIGTINRTVAGSQEYLDIRANVNDADIRFFGQDAGVSTAALQLDMSDGGTAIFNHDIKLPDSGQAIFGAGSDLKIYHDGSNSYIDEAGTGSFNIRTDGLGISFVHTGGSVNMAQMTQFGVTLHHNGNSKLATVAGGVNITGELEADSLDIDGVGDISGNLAVGGNTTVAGNETITGNLTVNGTTVDINANADVSGTMAVGSTLGVTGVTTLGANLGVTGNVTASGEVEGGSLDINGVADISGNLTIGSLDTSSQHVRGSINELHTELGDIAALNSTFANDSNLVAALNELQTEVGANSYPAGGPADTANPTNLTSAINAIDGEIGDTSYTGSDITGAIATTQTNIATINTNIGTIGSLATSSGNLVGAVNELHGEINSNDTDIATINTNIGSLGSLTTSVTSSIVNAINSVENEVDTTQANIGTINTNIGTIGNLATSAGALVTAINELHGEINSNDTDIGNLQTGKLSLTSGSSQTIASNLSFTGSGKTMTFAAGTTLDVSAATLTIGGGGGTLNFNTAFVQLDVDSNQQGLKVKRETITGVSSGAAEAQLRWNEGITDQALGWEVVYPNTSDDGGSITSSLVTFENARNLIANNTESAINVTFDDTNNNYDFSVLVDNSTIEVASGNLQLKNSGITANKLASNAVTTAKIAASAVTNAKIANGTIANAKLANSSITVSDGSNTSPVSLGGTLTFAGTNNEVTVAENAGTITIGLPDDVTIAGDLVVNGTTTTINTANLDIEDSTVRFAKNASTLLATNGAGLEFGASSSKPTILWDNTNTRLTTNKEFHTSVGFRGVGTNLTGLNASNISSGTINDARLPSTITSNITGNVTGNVTGDVTGNAGTATTLATSRNFSITGDITANAVGFDGSGAVVLNANIDANTVGPTEMIIGGTASDGKAIIFQSGAHQYSTISTTDTNTKYVINTHTSGSNAIIRLTSTGDDPGVSDDVTLAAGSNITLTESGDTITIASTQATVNNPQITIAPGALIDTSTDNNFTLNQSGAQTINVAVDLTELALETADIAGTDHLVYIDSGVQKKIAFSNVNLSAFDNTATGFTNNTGTVSSLSDLSITSTAAELNKLDGFTGAVADLNYAKDLRATGVTSTEFDFLDGVTSNIQTQLTSLTTSVTNINASNISSGTLASARLPDLAVGDFAGSAIQTSGESFSDSDTVLMTAKAIDDRIDGKGFTSNTGDITRVNITAGTGLTGSVNTTSGNHTQTLALSHLGIEDLVDPNADRIYFWDDSTNSTKFLTPGNNISISGTSLNVANTNVTTNLGNSRTTTAVTITSSDGTDTTLSAATASAAGVMTAAQVTTLNGLVSDTGTPAILSNGSSPSLNTGISDAEVRGLIGAGNMSSWTLTDAASTTEVIGNNETLNLSDTSYINLRITGSANARNIQASLNSNFLAFSTFTVVENNGNLISTITADNQQDTFTFKEGPGIDLVSTADVLTVSSTLTASDGVTLTNNNFTLSDQIQKDIKFNTSSTLTVPALYVDVSESRLGIGTNTPASGFNTAGAGSATTSRNGLTILNGSYSSTGGCSNAASDLYIANENGPGITLSSANDEDSHIFFSNTNDIADGRITYDNTSREFRFLVAGAKGMHLQSDGDLHVENDVIAFSTTVSDERLKENIKVVDNALDKVSQLKGVTFDWKKDGTPSAGIIAQDVEKVLPSAVKEKVLPLHSDNDLEYKVVQHDQITSLLVEAIKELREENKLLKVEIESLKDINKKV